jgi:hypothetical protein
VMTHTGAGRARRGCNSGFSAATGPVCQ